MKKTLLALAVPAALAAGTANAAINVYNSNGVTVDIGGAAEVQLFKSTSEDLNSTLRVDDGDFFATTTVEVAPGLRVLGTLGYFFESDGTDNAEVRSDELFVGFQSDFGTVTFGRQYTLADGAGNSKDYELGTSGIKFGDSHSSRVIKWTYDQGGMFYAGANAILADDNSANAVGESTAYEGLLGARYAGFDARVYYYMGTDMDGNYAPASADLPGVLAGSRLLQDINGFNFEIDYAWGRFDASASYGMVTFEPSKVISNGGSGSASNFVGTDDTQATTWQISAGYQADDRTYFAAGFEMVDTKATGLYQDIKGYSLYSNVTYRIHSNARVYAELGISDTEINNVESNQTDLGYVLGMEVSF